MSLSVTVRAVRDQRLADLELLEILAERMHAIGRALGARLHSRVTRSQRRRRALNRGALHVVQHAAHAAHLLAAARAPGPPCTSCGSGEPWPVDSFALWRLTISRRP